MFARVRYGGWVRWTVAGETAGFAFAALAGALVAVGDVGPGLTYGVMLLAGATEGALLGLGQSIGFNRTGLTVPRRAWIAATSVAAAFAWSIGLLPSTVTGIDWAAPLTWLVAGALALTLLLSIPVAQWTILHRVVNRAWLWLPLNGVAWALGLLWTFVPSPLVDERTPLPVLIAIYAVAGCMMALTVALITGWGVVRFDPLQVVSAAADESGLGTARRAAIEQRKL